MKTIAAALLAWCVAVAASGAPSSADEPVDVLRTALTNTEYEAAQVTSAIEAVVASGDVAGLPVLMAGFDRFGELLTQNEVDSTRARRALETTTSEESKPDAPVDPKVVEDKKVALDKATAAGSKQQQVLDAVTAGVPRLLDAIATRAQGVSVPILLATYEESTRRVGDLERTDEQQKGKLAQLSSKAWTLEQAKEGEAAGAKGEARERDAAVTEKLEMQAKVDRTRLLLDFQRTARAQLVETIGRVLRTAKGPEVEKALAQIEKRVDGKAAPAERALWIDLYARLGREDVPGELIGVAAEMTRTIKKGEADLVKLREQFEKLKENFFRAVEQGDGMVSTALKNSYDQMQLKLQEQGAQEVALERLRAAAARAVGAAVASLPEGSKKEKGITQLLTAAKGEKELETRAALLEGCAALDVPVVRDTLRKMLIDDRDVKARLAALEGLVGLRDPDALEIARTRLLAHENWRVRVAAVAALGRVPQKESIAPLIQALEAEQGRVREDIAQALQRLTGQALAMNADVWRRWWSENEATFRIEDVKVAVRRVAAWETDAGGKVTFYGISSVSKKVCFVLDVSKSMLEPIGGRGDRRKIDVAKEQLAQAIAALNDGDQFAIVIFAGSARRWSPKMTTVTAEAKRKVTEWIEEKVELDSGTNIHAGMKEAFSIAGMGSRDAAYDSAIDTMFFLSDGDATVGEVQDPLEIRRLIREWNKLSRIRIHCIGVGEAPNVALLYGIAEDSGGLFQKR